MKRLKGIAWLIGLVTVLGFGGYYYYQTEKEMESCFQQVQKLERGLNLQLRSALYVHDSLMLRLVSEPFTWAIRQHLLSDNITTIHQYLGQYVKHDAVKMIAVMSADKKIISCTDKKLEDRFFSDIFPEERFNPDQFFVLVKDVEQRAFHPIMGFDQRLGTLLIVYHKGENGIFSNVVNDSPS